MIAAITTTMMQRTISVASLLRCFGKRVLSAERYELPSYRVADVLDVTGC